MSRRPKEPAIFKTVRQQHATLWRELAKAKPADLIGIVRPFGVGGGKSHGDKQWTLQIDLLAWRIARGPIQSTELTVRKRCGERLISQFMRRLQPYDIVKFLARVATSNILGTPQAEMIRFVGKVQDATLERTAAQLKVPVEIKDPLFGTLVLNRATRDFVGRVKWSTRPIRTTFETSMQGSPDASIQTAHQLFRKRRSWMGHIERRITASLYDTWIKGWRIDIGDPKLTKRQFLGRLRLESISTCLDGSFSFSYDDRGLFGDHTVVVYGTLKRGISRATIEG